MQRIFHKINTISQSKYTNKILFFNIIFLLGLYIYFANSAVRNVSALEKISDKMDILSVRIGDLELETLAYKDRINIEKAKSLGFVEKEPNFIFKQNNKVLSLLK